MRSDTVKKGIERAGHRSLLRAAGVKEEDFPKPFIGIANSYTDIVPGHIHLQRLRGAWSRTPCARRAACPSSSTPSPWTMASPWATWACATPCPAAS